jgi:ethanolamine utilization microcompartment shell protein EutS
MTTSAELAALRATLEAFMKSYDSATTEAAIERKEMMRAISKLTVGQDKLAADMAEVKPVTDMVTGFRAKLTGALIVLGVVGAVAWAGIQFFKQEILKLLGG